jgi:HK97 gp10 family phage protein
VADPDAEVQSWFDGLSYKVKRQLAAAIKEQADGLAEAIKAAAPVRSGKLRDSVKVRRRKNELDLEVTAGGDDTIKELRQGAGVDYDYALATEYGTTKEAAEPFFYPTYHACEGDIRQAIEDAVDEAISKA